MRYAYDMLGNRIHQASMEAGARWMLNDVAGKPIRAWDSRGHNFAHRYDALRRPMRHVRRAAPTGRPGRGTLDRPLSYGEQHPDGGSATCAASCTCTCDQAGVSPPSVRLQGQRR